MIQVEEGMVEEEMEGEVMQVEEGMQVHPSGRYTPSCFPHCYQSFWSPGMRRVWGWLLGVPEALEEIKGVTEETFFPNQPPHGEPSRH